MAPSTIPLLARAIAADDDPLGIKNVSGFYGPGAWIAYSLTLVTSWVAVIRNDQAHNLHHIGYLLYINWAAIDLLRLSMQNLATETNSSSEQVTVNGQLGAAFLVTYWGIVHVAWQYMTTQQKISKGFSSGPSNDILNNSVDGFSTYTHGRRRLRILEFGIIIPTIAGLASFICLFMSGFDGILPALYWFDPRYPSNLVNIAILYGFNVFLIAVARCSHMLIEGLLGYPYKTYWPKAGFLQVVIWISATTFKITPALISSCYMNKLSASGGAIWRKSCFFMPCAPQSLLDWDQAFPALVGVIMAGYELGPHVPTLLRAVPVSLPVLLQQLKNFPQDFFHWCMNRLMDVRALLQQLGDFLQDFFDDLKNRRISVRAQTPWPRRFGASANRREERYDLTAALLPGGRR